MKRVTDKMVAEALLKLNRRTRCPAEKVTGADLDMAYDIARSAIGNPLPTLSCRFRGAGPKRLGLPENRYDKVLELYTEMLKCL